MKRLPTLLGTNPLTLVIGFAAGVIALPIPIAPPAPNMAVLTENAEAREYAGTFNGDRAGSDLLHWGEGDGSIIDDVVAFVGVPAPDYRLDFSSGFVEAEARFNALQAQTVEVGPMKTFNNFPLAVSEGTDPDDYQAVLV